MRTLIPIFAILVALASFSCKKNTSSISADQPTDNYPNGKTFLALGDSYTVGQSVVESQSFPAQTVSWLKAHGIAEVNAPQVIARTGWTTSELQYSITQAALTSRYDFVSLLIGVNDQYRSHDTIGYRERFTKLLDTAISFAGSIRSHVFVLSIPDYSVTPFAASSDTMAIRIQIDWYNQINKEVTLQNACQYLDITPSTRDARSDQSLLANDGLHPSGKEYQRWVERLAPMIKEALK